MKAQHCFLNKREICFVKCVERIQFSVKITVNYYLFHTFHVLQICEDAPHI